MVMFLPLLLIIPFLILRFYYMPKWVSEAAQRRGWDKRSWRICTFFFGLLCVAAYWVCVGFRTRETKQPAPLQS